MQVQVKDPTVLEQLDSDDAQLWPATHSFTSVQTLEMEAYPAEQVAFVVAAIAVVGTVVVVGTVDVVAPAAGAVGNEGKH